MLFTTAPFLLLFLPVTLVGFFLLGKRSHGAAAAWLLLASLFFYGYWMPVFTLLLLFSIACNFWLGLRLLAVHKAGGSSARLRAWLMLGVMFNLGLLGYFKYANFFVQNLAQLLGTPLGLAHVILPIGISFYCFTQIAFLVDTYHGKVREANILHYGLFVTYFPHLIAGPVLHHAQMMPQFSDGATYRPHTGNLVAGLLIFGLGMFKKVVLSDGVSPYASAIFTPVDGGALPTMAEAWLGSVAYTLQLYFDFSGYSDMAIGLSWMFNIRLPFNFNSPYRATSISDFWRRWHITLSAFLRDYLYIALGGNRHGSVRRYVNLMATMVLGGLWHGASWSFVIWGGLHGVYLAINHGFRAAVGARACAALGASRTWTVLAWALTLLCVVVAWVFFRAETLPGALRMLSAMAGMPGYAGMDRADSMHSVSALMWNAGLEWSAALMWCGVLGAIAVVGPNSNAIGHKALKWCGQATLARTVVATVGGLGVAFLLLVNMARDSVSAFIYFNF
jgi:alginate O-acetyltransferase complex protein AlgI